MDNHYFAIDVETANADYSSICQVGVAEFENGNILRTWKTNVNPEQYFDQFFEAWESLILKLITPRSYNGTSVSYKMDGNPDGPLYGESVVFTGTLSKPRSEMAILASEAGCRVQDSINKETSILVVGFQTEYRLGGYDKSSKQRKAEQMVEKGFGIKIVSEDDFRWMADLG